MRETTDTLIDRLAHEAKPVKAQSPLLRATVFVAVVAVIMGAFGFAAGDAGGTIAHLTDMPFAMDLFGAAFAGVGAIVAAVVMAVPGRSRAWFYLPLPGIALWLVGGGMQCYRQVAELGYVPHSLFASQECFLFIVGAGLPTAIAAYLLLRRNLSVDVVRVTALAGVGAAMMAAVLLQFVHVHGANPVDFGTHVVAVVTVMLFAIVASRLDTGRR
jgi:hypothetical protein